MSDSDSSIEHVLVPGLDRLARQQLAIESRRVFLTGGFIPELTQIVASHHLPLSRVSSSIEHPDFGRVLRNKILHTGFGVPLPRAKAKNKEGCAIELSQNNHFLSIRALEGRSQNDQFHIYNIITENSEITLETYFEFYPDTNSPPSLDTVLMYARQFLSAINFLHTKRLIHGSLLPYFIHFINYQVKVFLTPDPFYREDRGSPYTAIELRNGTLNLPNLQTDIYSVGSILFALLHAQDPPLNKTEAVFRNDIPAYQSEIIRACWSYNPNLARQDRPTIAKIQDLF